MAETSETTENPENPSPVIEAGSGELPVSGAEAVETIRQTENPTKTDEPTTAKPAVAQAGLGDRLRRAASGLFKFKGETYQKGGGRPRKCPECGGVGCDACDWSGKIPGKNDVKVSAEPTKPAAQPVAQAAAVAQVSSGAAGDLDSQQILRVAAASGIDAAFDVLDVVTVCAAAFAGIDDNFSGRVTEKCHPKAEKIAKLGDALQLWMKEANYQPDKPAQKAFLILAASMSAPYLLSIREFIAEGRRNREREMERKLDK